MKRIAISIAAGSLLAAVAMAQSPSYTITDLGNVGPNGQPFVITNNGLVVGALQTGAQYRRCFGTRADERSEHAGTRRTERPWRLA
jgi:hypothetical protein